MEPNMPVFQFRQIEAGQMQSEWALRAGPTGGVGMECCKSKSRKESPPKRIMPLSPCQGNPSLDNVMSILTQMPFGRKEH